MLCFRIFASIARDAVNDGEMEMDIEIVSYDDLQDLHVMIASIASFLQTTSVYPNNTNSPERPYCT